MGVSSRHAAQARWRILAGESKCNDKQSGKDSDAATLPSYIRACIGIE
jgi:hypothetical protein